ncbi:unnamed protein product [Cyprideis torosa]|uniref:Uncharacterized protein n=1 Tax=Cyprideis torosa TaxID=163714 RepID=A0A7R8ZIR0_9CRUS|nr:unnamed protein product [Cyprideis torosa]CAG0885268.1 unnamed protein product [Cyprideis torosa]
MGIVHAKALDVKNDSVQDGAVENFEDNRTTVSVSLKHVKAVVQKVNVEGLERTKDDVVSKCIQPLFKATSFYEMISQVSKVRSKLLNAGLFKEVLTFVDISQKHTSREDSYEITFMVQEGSRLVGSINTAVGQNEGSVGCGLVMPNAFGRGERAQVEYRYGTLESGSVSTTIRAPFFTVPGSASCGLASQLLDYPWSGFNTRINSTHMELKVGSPYDVEHTFRYEFGWRHIKPHQINPSMLVRSDAGHSIKSSVGYSFSRDQRDDAILPGRGNLSRVAFELAGLGGDVGFGKCELEHQINLPVPLLDLWTLQVSLQAGAMFHPFENKFFYGVDRFFLGGPLGLRGFKINGVGPHDSGFALGSEGYWAAGLHLYAPLPLLRGNFSREYLRTHAFLTTGNAVSMDDSKTLPKMLDGRRVSCGVGVVLRVARIARLELNYCFPIAFLPSDRVEPGFQFGVGMTFL